jgi:hypothetical protein
MPSVSGWRLQQVDVAKAIERKAGFYALGIGLAFTAGRQRYHGVAAASFYALGIGLAFTGLAISGPSELR